MSPNSWRRPSSRCRPGAAVWLGSLGAALLAAAATWLWVTAPGWLGALLAAPLGAVLAGWWWLGRFKRLGMES